MNFHIVTIFPDALKSYFDSSILGRAQKNKLIKIKYYNPRDYTKDKHKKVDAKQFGGGPGMVMQIEPLIKAVKAALSTKHEIRSTKIILLTPAGKQFDQKIAKDYAKKYDNIILICGHYEGIDARLKKVISDLGFKISDLSIGPYVLTGGELGAGIIVDSVSRYITGVLGKQESLEDERGVGIPVYTRPEVFEYKGKSYKVPSVLVSGHHENIKKWRNEIRIS